MIGKDYGDQARGTGAYSGQAPTGDGPSARELGQRLSNTQAQARANTARKEKERQDAIKADIAKRELEKLDYAPKNVFEKIGAYNRRYKQKFVARQKQKQKLAIDKFLEKVYGTNSPRMIDIAEVRDQLMSQYDPSTNTMKGLEGFNKSSINSITPNSYNNMFGFGSKIDINKNIGMNFGPTQLGPLGLKTKNVKGEPLSTKYMDQTPSLYSHPSNTPSIMGQVLGMASPPNINNLMSSFNRINQLDDIALGGVTQSEINDYYDKAQGKGKYDIFGGGGDGDGPRPYLPIDYNTGAATVEAVEPYTNDFVYRFGNEQKDGANVLRGYAADGGIMGTRARRAMGGIMNRVNQRQGYFLGGIGKAVGKVVGGVAKAAGKVLSSDLGKAAIIGAGIYYGGGGGNPFTKGGRDAFSFFGNKSGGGFFSKSNPLLFSEGKFNPMKFAGITTLGGFLGGPAKVDQLPGDNGTTGGRLKDSRGNEVIPSEIRAEIDEAYESEDPERIKAIEKYYSFLPPTEEYLPYSNYGSQGYRTTVATGGRIRAEEGGLMNLGGMEKDYRAEGGFVPIGKQEKADDVPARLSVNEFVFTADAVRNAGQGDIDKGAEVMENMMKNLENGGTVSEESQGNTGAQNMFSVSERIGEVI